MEERSGCLTACVRLEDVTPLPSVYPEGSSAHSDQEASASKTLIDDAPEGTSQRTILWYRKDKPCNRSMSRPLASLGISEIAVFRRLRIAILSTGEELVSLSAVTKE